MNNCSNLFILSTIACKLADCLSDEELEALAANLNVLGDMIESTLANKSLCKND